MKRLPKRLAPIVDILLLPIVDLAAKTMKLVRWAGIYSLRRVRSLVFQVDVYPIIGHFYEPLFNPRQL